MSTRRVPLRIATGRGRVLFLLLAAVPLAAVLLLTSAEARAHRCDRTDNDRREATRVIRNLTQEIDEMERAIIEALRLQTGQLSGYTAQSAKAIAGALDSQTRLQAQIAREAAETGRIVGDRAVVDRPGAAAGDAARFEALTKSYCNAGRAGEDPALCRGASALHGADLRAGTLFDRRTFASEEELRAAVELSRNLAAPVVHDPPPLSSADTERERRRALLARAADARTALAADYFAGARALRAPGAALGDWAAAIGGDAGRGADTPVSRYELVGLLASRRFEDPDWFVSLQAMSQENLLRELVTLQAVSLMLDWQRYRTDERRGAIDAASLALATEEMRRLPGLANPAAGAN